MSAGIGALSGLGVAVEGTPGTGEASADFYLPILSESIAANRESVPSGSIVGDAMTSAVALGISTVEGGMSMEIEGSVSGMAIYLWSGPDGYTADAVDATHGQATAAPTGAAAAGGTLAAGAYKYKVATVLARTLDGKLLIMPASANSAAITTSSGDLTVNLSWTNPSALPSGHTHYGTIIYRTLAAGADNSQKFLKLVTGTGSSTTDTGSVALGTILPFTTSLYVHEFLGSPPVSGDRLEAFSVLVFKDNDNSERYVQCRMDTMKIAVGGPNEKMIGDFTLKGTKAEAISNFTPAFVPLEPFVGWHAAIQRNGVTDCTVENFEINCSNNVNPVPGLCATAFNRDVISGKRDVTVSFARQFENHDYWDMMLAGTEFALKVTSYGESVLENPALYSLSVGGDGGVDAVPFQFFIEIDLFRLRVSKAGGNIPGPDRIIESIEATAFKSATENTEMRIRLWNATALYS